VNVCVGGGAEGGSWGEVGRVGMKVWETGNCG